jgi:hypothetical protein
MASIRFADLQARPVEQISCRSTGALSRHWDAFQAPRVSSRARRRARIAASSRAGP